jgi:3-oxoacyl-[acyl-carrier protein] reductase
VDLGLAGSAFLATGASRGLGLAGARVLREEGADVLLSARTAADVERAAASIGAVPAPADLGGPTAAAALVEAALAAFGRLDGALVSVGGPPPGHALALTDAQWQDSFETVLLGVVRLLRAVVPVLPDGSGSVVLVLSTSAKQPLPGLSASNALRPGLAMLVKDLADELGPRGVRVNAVLPGTIATERLRQLDGGDPAAAAARAARVPLRRLGEPLELGRVAAFLLSPAASYVTGVVVPVDGGALRAL